MKLNPPGNSAKNFAELDKKIDRAAAEIKSAIHDTSCLAVEELRVHVDSRFDELKAHIDAWFNSNDRVGL